MMVPSTHIMQLLPLSHPSHHVVPPNCEPEMGCVSVPRDGFKESKEVVILQPRTWLRN